MAPPTYPRDAGADAVGVGAPLLPGPIALVLSGGATLGAVQVGMVDSMLHGGVRPDFVVGTSVGALNAAMVAADPELAVDRLAALWRSVRRSEVFPMHPPALIGAALGRTRHLIPSTGLGRLIERSLPVHSFADCALPLTAVATDELTGHLVELDAGPLLPALLASSAIPGVFPAVRIGGRSLVDGGLAANVPIGVAMARGARSVVVADAAAPCHLTVAPRTIPEILVHTLGRLTRLQVAAEAELAGARAVVLYLPTPCTTRRSPLEFSGAEQLISAARQLSREFLAELAGRAGQLPDGLYGSPHRHTASDAG